MQEITPLIIQTLIVFGVTALFSLALTLIVSLNKNLIWSLRHIFIWLNYVQWTIYNPLRFIFKNPKNETSRIIYLLLMITLVTPIYWITVHILMTPLRVLNALYFDVLLYVSVMLDDTLKELINPKIGQFRRRKGIIYLFSWIISFPLRLLVFLAKLIIIVFDIFLMLGSSFLLPVLTMYHGTAFSKSASNILQTGLWKVGGGSYAGTGIYFGIKKDVAEHYASPGEEKAVIVARVIVTFTRNQATLDRETRELVGRDGQGLSASIRAPWVTIEHWRSCRGGWWEYCLVQPGKTGKFIKSWRIRPVAITKEGKITRLWGGFSHYSLNFGNIIIGFVCWAVLLAPGFFRYVGN